MFGKLQKAILACKHCDLHQQCTKPVPPIMKPALVMVVGRNPGEQEDKIGEPFIGRAGKKLDQFLEEAGIGRKNCYITNTVKCFTRLPTINRPPSTDEIKACSGWLKLELLWIKPAIIITTGREALSLFCDSEKMSHAPRAVSATRGIFADLANQIDSLIFPTYHPSYILRNGSDSKYMGTAKILKSILEKTL